MNMKKLTSVFAFILVLVMLLAACGTGSTGDKDDDQEENKTPAYPALELPDVSGMSLTEVSGTSVKFSCPADDWTVSDDGNPVMLYLNETIEDDAKVNMSVKYEAELKELTDKDLADIKSGVLSEDMSFMEATAAEFRSVGDEKVMYLDLEVTDVEAYVDFIIENAGLDDATLEALGGREGILAVMPASSNLMVYFVRDGHLFSMSGIYFTGDQKDALLEFVSAAFSTLEKK